MKHSV